MNYSDFRLASTLIHASQGAALMLAAFAGYLSFRRPGSRAPLAGFAALLAAAVAGPLLVALLPGERSFSGFLQALAYRSGFRMYIALSCFFGAAGLTGLMSEVAGPRAALWRRIYLGFLSLIGAAYIFIPWRVNADAWSSSMAAHSVIGGLLILSVISEAGYGYFGRRNMRAVSLALLLLSGVRLLVYRESEEAYGPRMVTLSTESAPAANAPTADKERPGN